MPVANIIKKTRGYEAGESYFVSESELRRLVSGGFAVIGKDDASVEMYSRTNRQMRQPGPKRRK